ncbi:MAG: ABC transporter ATP-binding protein [Lachnospiraceae bacterium]
MGKIFKYLSAYKSAVFGIVVLLIVQAYCDLSLPQYMSDIVDVGIQQGGIEHAAPEEMRGETLENLSIFMEQDKIDKVTESYTKQKNGTYKLNIKKEAELEELDKIMGMPMVFMSMMTEQSGMDMNTMKEMIKSGKMTKEEILTQEDDVEKKFGDMSESIISQKALLFVQEEYKALGWDLGDYQNSYLFRLGGKMLAMSVVMMVSAILAGLLAAYVSAKVGMNLRSRVFKKVVAFSNHELEEFSTASLITRSTNDIQQVQMVSVMLLRMVAYAPIVGIGGVIKVASTRTGMGWIIGVAVGSIILLVGVLMSITMPKFKKMQTLVDRLNLVSREILMGIPVIRAFSREKYEEKRFAGANQDLMKTQLFTSRVMSMMMPMMMLIMNCITILIVWFGAKGIDLGNLQVGDMMAFITYTMQIVMAFLMITMISVMLPRAGVAAGRIDEVINTSETIVDVKQPLDDTKKDWNGEVSFEDVTFQYPGAEEDALSHICFTAKPGETTAIIGSTGCGKSTLLNLIPRFYDVTQGKITMDGIDIRNMTQKKLRSLIGYVPQKGVLFSGTIASNIQFSGDVSEDKMKEAARISQSEDFITEKEEEYESHIAQGGTNVSGGQKQRLSIARAIAKSPKVFLFDDSFSALDYKTDIALRKALYEKTADAAVIIVAQRISTILHANKIIVLEDGAIAGMGTHQELMKTCETYQEIAKSQLSQKELEGGMAL